MKISWTILLSCISLSCFSQDVFTGWARNFEGNFTSGSSDLVVDTAGNVYTTGYFSGETDFDPGPGTFILTPVGTIDMYVSKLDSAGNFVWAFGLSGEYQEDAYGLTLNNGNVLLTGNFGGTLDFDPGPEVYNLTSSVYGSSAFVANFDPEGNLIWAKGFYSFDGLSTGYSIKTDIAHNIYMAGIFRDTVDVDPGIPVFNLVSSASESIFVCKLNELGEFIWAKCLGGVSCFGLAVDELQNVYVTGSYKETADFDPGDDEFLLTSQGEKDAFVCKLGIDGNLEWVYSAGSETFEGGECIVTDENGNVYVSGFFLTSADFDPGPEESVLTNQNGQNSFLVKLSVTGEFLWAKSTGGVTHDLSMQSGRLYAVGSFGGVTSDFDPGPDTYNLSPATNNHSDIFVSCLDEGGDFIWAKRFGAQYNDEGHAIDLDPFGNIHVCGNFFLTVNFDCNEGVYNLDAGIGQKTFILKLWPNGETELEENDILSKVIVSPNPGNEHFQIDLNKSYSWVKLKLTDSEGKLLIERQFLATEGISFDLIAESGIYFVELVLDTEKLLPFKLVKI